MDAPNADGAPVNASTTPDDQTLDNPTVSVGEEEVVETHDEAVELAPTRNFATPKRAFSSLVEHAPARTVDITVRMDGVEGGDSLVADFLGYAYTIDDPYDVVDWLGIYREAIGPGASSKTLRESTSIPLLLNHDGLPLANTSSGTSQLADDGHGLRNAARLDRRQGITNDICIALERRDIGKMSFSFGTVKDAWNDSYDDRYVTELRLFDTSIVTNPANPNTSADLVDEMRSAMGREGRSLWLAENEPSIRSALPALRAGEPLEDGDAEDLLERALRALVHADDVVMRSRGPQGRARTFMIGRSLLDLRAGKVLSSANQTLLTSALTALSSADQAHQSLTDAHSEARRAVSDVLDNASGVPADGEDEGVEDGDPLDPQDGAGDRSVPPGVLAARHQLARLQLRAR